MIYSSNYIGKEELDHIQRHYAHELPQVNRAVSYYLKRTPSTSIRKTVLLFQVRSWLFNVMLFQRRVKLGILVKCPFCKHGFTRRKICNMCHGSTWAYKSDLKQLKRFAKEIIQVKIPERSKQIRGKRR